MLALSHNAICFLGQIGCFPQFMKLSKNLETGEGIFVLADEFARQFSIAFTKPPSYKQVVFSWRIEIETK